MQKIGVIDLGSNTTRLIVMSYTPDYSFRLIDEVSETVRLAEGVDETGMLQPVPIMRAVEALKMFETFCRSTDVSTVIAVGTSAIREAANQDQFWDALRSATSLDLRIISAEEEAFYGYLGAANSLGMRDGFVFDTGGGSTQVVQLREGYSQHSFSIQAGVLRFTERYVTSDPISKRDLRELRQAARQAFASLDWLVAEPDLQLAGMGGTVRTLARMDQKQRGYPLDRLHGYVLSRSTLADFIDTLARKNRREREMIPGLKSDRADVTLAGAVIIDALMERSGFETLHVSGQGVREGLFYEHFLQGRTPSLIEHPRSFSVLSLARLYNYEREHTAKVAEISLSLFDQLVELHGYGIWERELLYYAAILHDIGVTVGYYDHHKHSAYLVHNAALMGFSHREVVLLAALVRNHRKGQADLREFRMLLESGDEERVARLSSLLRIAEYLERSKSQVVRSLTVRLDVDPIEIVVAADGDVTVEVWDANRRTGLFRKSFGREVNIQAA
jgi:exopolyphosphatase/guanosine-5'-triphosphate,3'-diphosphate pyrophosphatase